MTGVRTIAAATVLALLFTACGTDDDAVGGPSVATSDAASDGAGSIGDGVASDTGAIDAGSTDTGSPDTGTPDTGAPDDTWIWQDTSGGDTGGGLSGTPVALTVVPPAATLPIGGQIALAATAKLDDGSSVPATGLVEWSSSAPDVVQVNAAGVAVAVSAGSATLTAKLDALQATAVLTVSPLAVTALALSPAEATIAIGASQTFSAIATLEGGSSEDVSASATWSVDDPTVAKITGAGVLQGLLAGTTTVRAKSGGKEATAKLTVKPAAVQGLSLTPANGTVIAGGTLKMTLTAVYDDNTVADVTAAASWSSSAPATAKVDAGGVVTGLAAGGAVISASFGGKQASRPVTVEPKAKKLKSIAITPATVTLAAGAKTTLKATGTWDDGTTSDLSTTALWASSDTAKATVSNDPKSAGELTALAAGDVVVSASFDGVSGEAKVSVSAATLTKLAINPGNATVPLGLATSLQALGTYSDGKVLDVTGQAVWTSAPAGVVTVANGAEAGKVTGAKVGQATVTATLEGQSAVAKVTVLDSVLTKIAVDPATATVEVGSQVALKAKGTWSDGTVEDLTDAVAWTSSDDKLATVSNAKGSQGEVGGVAPGKATVTAAIGKITGSAAITVSAPTLSKLTIGPTDPVRKAGQWVQFWVVAEFSNGATVNVTQQAKWSSSNPAVASVNASGFNTGLAQAKAKGKATISASFGGKTATSEFTVTTAEVVSVQVSPATWTVAAGLPMQFQAVAIFSDDTTQNVTWQANWSGSDDKIATIGNATPGPGGQGNPNLKGRAMTKQPGKITVTATYQGFKGTGTLTVTSAQAQSISLFPGKHTCSKGEFRNFQASLLFSDGTSVPVNQPAAWTSSDNKIAAALNGNGQKGLVQCLESGTVTITAAVMNFKGTAEVEVSKAKVKELTIQPKVWSVAVGVPVKFDVAAVYDDGTTQNVSWATTFVSSDNSVASVFNGGGTAGWTQTLKPGKVTVTATWSGKQVTAELTVKKAEVTSIEVSPPQPTLAPGTFVKLHAVAVMSDKTTQQITGAASWVSDKPGVATVFNGAQGNPQANQNKGLVQTLTPGKATISATWGGKTGSTVVTVQQAAIQEIQVTPFDPVLPIGYVTPLQATAVFTDLSTQNLTHQVGWVSSDPSVVAVASIGPTMGWATPLKAGTATISATNGGKTGTVKITVTDAKLQSIEVSAGSQSVGVQQTLPLKALGKFSGGLSLDITNYATWLSSDASVVGVSNAWGSWGQAKGLKAGKVTITAARDGVQGTYSLSVGSP